MKPIVNFANFNTVMTAPQTRQGSINKVIQENAADAIVALSDSLEKIMHENNGEVSQQAGEHARYLFNSTITTKKHAEILDFIQKHLPQS